MPLGRQNRFVLEWLEPRRLLSGASGADGGVAELLSPEVVSPQIQPSVEVVASPAVPTSQGLGDLYSPAAQIADLFGAGEASGQDPGQGAAETEPGPDPLALTEASDPRPDDPTDPAVGRPAGPDAGTTTEPQAVAQPTMTAQLTETLDAANGPPAVDPPARACAVITAIDDSPTDPAAQGQSVVPRVTRENPESAMGSEFRINPTTAGNQSSVVVAAAAAGDYVAVWQGPNPSASSIADIYGQRFNAEGTPIGPEFEVQTGSHGSLSSPDLAMAPDGRFVVSWTADNASDLYDIFARVYGTNGLPLTDAFRVNATTANQQCEPDVAMDADGSFVIVWQSYEQDGSGWGVYGQRFDAAGAPLGTEFAVNTYTPGGEQTAPVVAMASPDRFVVAWSSYGQDGSEWGVYAQRFGDNGSAVGAEFLVNSYTSYSQDAPAIAMNAGGDFVIVWASNGQDGSGTGVYGQRYAADGSAVGGEFAVNTYTNSEQNAPALRLTADGSLLAAWQSYAEDGSGYGVYARRYAADGSAVGDEFRVNEYTSSDQYGPSVAWGAGGDFLVAWTTTAEQDGSGTGVYGRLYGTGLAGADLVPVLTTAPSVAAFGDVITLSAQFRNQGGWGWTSWFSCQYFLSTDPAITADDTPLSEPFTTDGIGAWTTYTDTRDVRLSDTAPAGDLYVGLLVDKAGEISEVNESNNGNATVSFARIRTGAAPTTLGGVLTIDSRAVDGQRQVSDVAVAADAAGNYVLVWQRRDLGMVWGQRYNAQGTRLGPEFQVSQGYSPDVAAAANGQFVVTWSGSDGTDSTGVFARVFAANGAPLTDAFRVNTVTNGTQNSPQVAADSQGNFLVVWQSDGQEEWQRVPVWGVYGQRYRADGTPVGTEFKINTSVGSSHGSNTIGPVGSVAMAPGGAFVVVWDHGGSEGVDARLFAADGTAQGNDFRVNTERTWQGHPAVGMADDGTFVVSWETDSGGYYDYVPCIVARRFGADGTPLGEPFRVSDFNTPGPHQFSPAIAMAADGKFVISWYGYYSAGSYGAYWYNPGVFAQRYRADGTAMGPQFCVEAAVRPHNPQLPAVACGADDDFLIAWQVLDATWLSEHSYSLSWSAICGRLYGTGRAGPDLVPVQVTASQTGVNLGSALSVSAELRNQGSTAAGPFTCQYYVSTDALITTEDTPVGTPFTVSELAAWSSYTDSRQAAVPPFAPVGSLYVGLLVDVNGEVAETDETNNGTATASSSVVHAWPPPATIGGEFQVNPSTSGHQSVVTADADAAGNVVAVWQGANTSGYGTSDIYGQRYNAQGTRLGFEFQVNPDWHGEQTNPDVAVTPDGRFVVTWTTDDDGDGTGVMARLFAANGVPLTDAFRVNTFTVGNQSESEVAISAAGTFVIVWQSDGQDLSGLGVYGQRYAADGRPVGLEFRVNTYTTEGQQDPMPAMSAGGAFLVVWQSNGQDGSASGVYGQRYAADGSPAGAEFRVNTTTSGEQYAPALDLGADGSFVVAWQSSGQDGSGYGVIGQRFNAAGQAVGPEFRVNSYTDYDQLAPAVAVAADGGFVIAWQSYPQDTGWWGVYAQRYQPDGTVLGGEWRANSYWYYEKVSPTVVAGVAGNFLVAWQSQSQDGSEGGIFGQLYGTGLAGPDLVPVRVLASQKGVNLGSPLDLTAELRNQGSAAAGLFSCQYYLSPDPLITASDTPIGMPFVVNELAAWSTYSDSRQVDVPVDAPVGNFYVSLLLDAGGEVVEADETNNGTATVSSASVHVWPPPAPIGAEFRANILGPVGDQSLVSVDADAAGNVVAVWQGANTLGYGTNDIYGQRFNAFGTALGPEFRVNSDWHGEQTNPDVAVAADGRFVVTWTADDDGDGSGVYARVFAAEGTPLTDPFRANTVTAGTQIDSEVALSAAGAFLIVWESNSQDGSGWGIYAQRYAPDGTPLGSEFRVNTYVADSQMNPMPAMSAAGDFVVVWESNGQDGSGWGVYGRRYGADGTALGGEFRVNTTTWNDQLAPAVDLAADGSFVVTWQGYTDGSGYGIWAQCYGPSGQAAGPEFRVNSYWDNDQSSPAVAMAADGSFVIAWQSWYQDGSDWGIYAQRCQADGTVLGGEFRVNSCISYGQSSPALVVGPGGRFLVAWESQYEDGNGWGIFGQFYGTSPAGTDLVPVRVTAIERGIQPGHMLNLSAEIRNQGSVAAGPFSCQYYLSTDPQITTADTPLSGLFGVPGLGAFSACGDSRQVQVPLDAPLGDLYVGLLVDEPGEVAEPNEANNGTATASVPILNVWPAPAVVGGELPVNPSTTGDQTNVAVAADAAGNYVLVWQGTNTSGYGTNEIYGQRVNAEGTPIGREFRVNPDWRGDKTGPDIAMATDGRFVVTWTESDGDSNGVFARRFAADATPLSDAFRVNTYTVNAQSGAKVAMAADGSFVIVWQSVYQDGSDWGVFGQRYAADGTPVGREFQVNTTTDLSQNSPALAMSGTGDFIVAWSSSSPDWPFYYDVYAQRYAADGGRIGREFRVNTYTQSQQSNPSAALAADGSFIITWVSDHDGSENGVYAQRFAPDGSLRGDEFLVNTRTYWSQQDARLALAPDGTFLIAWTDYCGAYPDYYEVRAQRYRADGRVLGGEFRVNTYNDNYQYTPAVALGAGGDLLIGWSSYGQDGSGWGVYAQIYGSGLAQADLIPAQVYAPNGANLGQTVTVGAVVRNQGATDAGAFTCQFYLSQDATISTADTPLGEPFTVSGLAAYATTTTEWRTFALPNVTPGAWYVGLVVDTTAAVPEADEANNAFRPAPDQPPTNLAALPLLSLDQRVNTCTADQQSNPIVGLDALGNAVVVWHSSGQDGSSYGVYAQRFSASGEPVGGEFLVNTTTADSQQNPVVAVAPDGRFAVAWTAYGQDGSDYGVYARLFAANGTPLGDEFQVNTYTDGAQFVPAIAMDGAGNFVIVWQSSGQDASGNTGIFGQRYRADGTPERAEFWVCSNAGPDQYRPDVAMNAAGQFVVVWDGGDGATIYGRRFLADGTAAGDEFVANTFTAGQRNTARVAIDTAGRFLITWHSYGQESGWGVYGQRFAANGARVGDEFRVNSYTSSEQYAARTGMDGAGNFLVVWESYGQDGDSWGVFARRYAADGSALGDEFRVGSEVTGLQQSADVAMLDPDHFLVAWHDGARDGSSYGVYLQVAGVAGDATRPNLTVTQVTAPANAYLGQPLSLAFTLRNTGLTVAPATTAQVWLSDDPLLDPATDLATGVSVAIPQIFCDAWNNTFESTATYTWPDTDPVATDRDYYFILLSDSANVVTESSETDNTQASNLVELRLPDLVATVSVPTGVVPGDPFTLNVEVWNQGDASASASTAHLWLSDDDVLGNADDKDLFIDVPVPELRTFYWPDYSYTKFQTPVNYTWPLVDPYDTDGPHYFILRLDTAAQMVEQDEQNNLVLSNAFNVNRPNLVVQSLTAPAQVDQGQPISVAIEVRNVGAARAAPSTLHLWLSDDNLGGNADDVDLGRDIQVPLLEVWNGWNNGRFLQTVTITWPASDPFRTDLRYFVVAKADATSQVRESNETDNYGVSNVIALRLPDLQFASVTLPTTVVTGQQLVARVVLRNHGLLEAPASRARVWLSDNTSAGDADDLEFSPAFGFDVPQLAAGTTWTGDVTIPWPASDPFGTDEQYYLVMQLDALNQVVEGNETNNQTVCGPLLQVTPLDLDIQLAGHWGGAAYDVAFAGNYAYALTNAGVRVLDISDPATVRKVSELVFPAEKPLAIQAVGTRLYTVDNNAWRAYDISTPYQPVLLTERQGIAAAAAAFRGHLAIIGTTRNTLALVDLTVLDPAPAILVEYPLPSLAKGVAVDGNLVVVSYEDPDSTRATIELVDITNPAAPAFISCRALDRAVAGPVAVSGDLLAVLQRSASAPANSMEQVVLLDISDRLLPWVRAVYSPPGQPCALTLTADTLLVAERRPDTQHLYLDVVDVTHPADPALLVARDLGLAWESADPNAPMRWRLRVHGTTAAVAHGPLALLDLSDRFHPLPLADYAEATDLNRIALSGSIACLTTGRTLVLLDVSEPGTPRLLARYACDWVTDKLAAAGRYLFLTEGLGTESSRVHILDIADPTAPVLRGTWEHDLGTGYLLDVAVSGNRLYALAGPYPGNAGAGSVQVFDVSEPAAPMAVSSINLFLGTAPKLAVAGDRLYVADSYPADPEPNDTPTAATLIPSLDQPVALRGILAPYSYDQFRFAGNAGDLLTVDLRGQLEDAGTLPAGYAYVELWGPGVPVGTRLGQVTYAAGEEYANFTLPRTGTYRLAVYGYAEASYELAIALNAPLPRLAPYHGVDLYDLTDPAAPVLRSTLNAQQPITGLAAGPQRAYVSLSEPFLVRVLDFTDPAQPTLGGSCQVSQAGMLVVNGPLAAVAAGNRLQMVDVTDPLRPIACQTYTASEPVGGIVSQGMLTFIAADSLYALSVRPAGVEAPDLAVTQLALPPAVELGTALPVTWTVRNQGRLAAEGSWTDAVYLSSDALLSDTDLRLGELTHTGPLDPLAIYTPTASFPVTGVEPGYYYIIVRTDAADTVNEWFVEQNNLRVSGRPLYVGNPDLTVTQITVPEAVARGDLVALTWRVQNNGLAPAGIAAWTDAVYLSADEVLDENDLLAGEVTHSATLDPGATYEASLQVNTTDLIGDLHYVLVRTDSGDAVPEDAGEQNNTTLGATPLRLHYPDLAVTHLEVPAVVLRGDPLPIQWTVHNRELVPAAATSWTDAVYLSTDATFDPATDTLVGSLEHTGGLAPRTVYRGSLSLDTSAMAEAAYYVIVCADTQQALFEDGRTQNNVAVAETPFRLGVPALTLGQPLSGSFDASGQSKYYRLETEAGKHLFVTLNDANDTGHNELYLKFGSAPSRGSYDAKYSANLAADQQIEIAETQAGNYYVLVFAEFAPDTPAGFTLTAELRDFAIVGLTNYYGGNVGSVTVGIRGSGFTADILPELIAPNGETYYGGSLYWQERNQVYATFDLAGAAVGAYDLRMQVPDGAYTELTDVFQVRQGTGPELVAHLLLPGAVRPGQAFTIAVEYTNQGDTDMYSPILTLTGPEGMALGFAPGQTDAVGEVSFMGYSSSGPAGVLQPGDHQTVTFHATASGAGTLSFSLASQTADFLTPSTDLIDWAALRSEYQPPFVDNAAWDPVWRTFALQVGATWDDVIAALARQLTENVQQGDTSLLVDDLMRQQLIDAMERGGGLTDSTPPFVLGYEVNGLVTEPVSSVDVFFSENIAADSFTAADVAMTNPAGAIIGPVTITALSPRVYRIAFPGQTAPGLYHVLVGPHLADTAGLELDEDGSGSGGEGPDDQFDAAFVILPESTSRQGTGTGSSPPATHQEQQPLSVSAHSPETLSLPRDRLIGLAEVCVHFSVPISGNTFANDDVTLTAVTKEGKERLVGVRDVELRTTQVFLIHFVEKWRPGTTYHITIGPDVKAQTGASLNRYHGTIVVSDPTGPRVVQVTPSGPVAAPISSVTIEFDRVVRVPPAAIPPAASPVISVSLPDGRRIDVQNPTLADTKLTVQLSQPLTGPGEYAVSVVDIEDMEGRKLDQDGDGKPDSYRGTFSIVPTGSLIVKGRIAYTGGLETLFPEGAHVWVSLWERNVLMDSYPGKQAPSPPPDSPDRLVSQKNLLTGTDMTTGRGEFAFVYDLGSKTPTEIRPDLYIVALARNDYTAVVEASTWETSILGSGFGYAYIINSTQGGRTYAESFTLSDGSMDATTIRKDCMVDSSQPDSNPFWISESIWFAGEWVKANVDLPGMPRRFIICSYPFTDPRPQVNAPNNAAFTCEWTTGREYIEVGQNVARNMETLFHEYGHAIRYALNGYSQPPTGDPLFFGERPTYGIVTESRLPDGSEPSEAKALNEGWASWFAAILGSRIGQAWRVYDWPSINRAARPETNDYWMGQDAYDYLWKDRPGDGDIGLYLCLPGKFLADGINDNGSSGAIVMGAVESILWDWWDGGQGDDDPLCDPTGLWKAMKAAANSGTVRALWDAAIAQNTKPEYRKQLASIFIDHGVAVRDDDLEMARIATAKSPYGTLYLPIENDYASDPTPLPLSSTPGTSTAGIPQVTLATSVPNLIMAEEGQGKGDWFSFSLPAPTGDVVPDTYEMTVTVGFDTRYGDLDLLVYERNDPGIMREFDVGRRSDSVLGRLVGWLVGRKDGTATITFKDLSNRRSYDFLVCVAGYGVLDASGNVTQRGGDYNPDYSLTVTANIPEPKKKKKKEDDKSMPSVGSRDPNDKIGPAGAGEAHFITPGLLMPYSIYYENDPEVGATAAAQVVRIEDQLNANLDWSTFELGRINLYDDFWIDVPAGLQHYEHPGVDLRPQGVNLLVRVNAGLDSATGRVTWLFESLDPETLAPPEDAFAGFLPVNDKALHNGEGHLSYTVRAKSDLATGAQIVNQALNYFDTNEAVPTPTTLHTIDAGRPTSQVQPLASPLPDAPFTVTWRGEDDANGSGIASYTIYVSMDGGAWEVWLDDTPNTSAEFTGVGGHTYAFRSVARDQVGQVEADPGTAEATTTLDYSQFRVVALETTPSGFVAHFRRALDAGVLNLYNTATAGLGPADVTVVGDTVGPVAGSLLYDAAARTVTFVKTGGVLAPDTYTLTLRSAANAFRDAEGHLLDGDADNTEGGNLVTRFTVDAALPPVLALPDFARGPGQAVSVPVGAGGIPVTLSDGSGVQSVDFELDFDPALLDVSGVLPGAGLPASWGLAYSLTRPGHLAVTIYGPAALPAGPVGLVSIQASVPGTALYRAVGVLALANVTLNEGALAVVADRAVQVVAYLGETTGNASYSGLDVSTLVRVAAGSDSGFAAYPLLDPVILADITGNGRLSGLDAAFLARKTVGLPQPDVPDLPGTRRDGATRTEPRLQVASAAAARAGGNLVLPVTVSAAAGLQAVDLTIAYDTTRFDLGEADVQLGDLLANAPAGWSLLANVDESSGRLRVIAFSTVPLAAGTGNLLEITWHVRDDAQPGSTGLDLGGELNEGRIASTAVSGTVTIVAGAAATAVADAYPGVEDSALVSPSSVLANDTGAPGASLTAMVVSQPSHGTLTLAADGTFTYQPAQDFNGADAFTYKVSDGTSESEPATVSLTIQSVNDAPVAGDDAWTTAEDTTLTGASVLANDSDAHNGAPDENNAPLTAQLVTDAANGTLTLNPDGTFTYKSAPGFIGEDRFTYVAKDNRGGTSSAATVTITVQPVIRTVSVTLEVGWNLISVPVTPDDPAVGAVFRSVPVPPTVYEWRDGGYRQAATIEPKRGYWVRLDGRLPATVSVSGRLAWDKALDLAAGWNLVGPVADAALPTTPAAANTSWWCWDTRFQEYRLVGEHDLLQAGRGYWVHAANRIDGVLLLSSPTRGGTATGAQELTRGPDRGSAVAVRAQTLVGQASTREVTTLAASAELGAAGPRTAWLAGEVQSVDSDEGPRRSRLGGTVLRRGRGGLRSGQCHYVCHASTARGPVK